MADTWQDWGRAKVFYAALLSPTGALRAMRALRQIDPELLHFNSFFNPVLTILPLLLWRIGYWGRPIVLLAPRGEFGDGALWRRARKKKLYISLFRLLRLDRGVIWHSTADHETQAIREMWGAEAHVVLRENDTLLPLQAASPTRPTGPLVRLVFLGRIVEHKGLLVALEALRGFEYPVSLDIYGSREDPVYATRCELSAQALPAHVSVAFHNAVQPDEVRGILGEHDVLLMPTAGENFGHVIAEALSVSCMVMTTPHTPWSGVMEDGGGFVIDRTPSSWHAAIERVACLDADALYSARRLAGESYTRWAARPRKAHIWELAFEEAARA